MILGWFFVTLLSICCEVDAGDSFGKKFSRLVREEPPQWMLNQIDSDLASYKLTGITQDSLDRLVAVTAREETVRFHIESNQISYVGGHRDCQFYQQHLSAVVGALETLAEVVSLPDVDFVVNVNDYAIHRDDPTLAPLLVFSKNKYDASQVLIPDPEALKGYSKLTKKIIVASKKSPWRKKKNVAFWRGATTGGRYDASDWQQIPRAKLVLLSLQYPEFIDAKFHIFLQGAESNPAMLAIPALKGPSIRSRDSLDYKYLIDIDGNTCGWSRLYWTLLSNCVVLKQMTDSIEWYYGKLKPYTHFVPVNADLSDLLQKIDWAKQNDRLLQDMSKNATYFVKENLSEEMIYLYLYWVLVRYSELQKFQ